MNNQLTRLGLAIEYDRIVDWAESLSEDDPQFGEAWSKENELRYRMRTICDNCGREGAEDHHDRNGIYAGRWHDHCATAADRHRANYKHNPGEDEPLEED